MKKHTPSTFKLKPGAEPFLLDGGDVGCVCTHGFTASPEEMRWLGEYLNARGLTVYGPRLAGHGIDPALMRRQHRATWLENVIDGVTLLRARCRRVFSVGLSMGGLLSLQVGALGLVDGVGALAAPIRLHRPAMRFSPVIKYVRPYVPKANWPGELDAAIRAEQRAMGREDYGRGDYDTVPTESAWQLYALMQDVRRDLPHITAPLLLIYSTNDQTVPYDNMALIAQTVHSRDIVQHTLTRSDHVLTQDIERETVYEMVWDFLSSRLDSPGSGEPGVT